MLKTETKLQTFKPIFYEPSSAGALQQSVCPSNSLLLSIVILFRSWYIHVKIPCPDHKFSPLLVNQLLFIIVEFCDLQNINWFAVTISCNQAFNWGFFIWSQSQLCLEITVLYLCIYWNLFSIQWLHFFILMTLDVLLIYL